MEGQDRTKRAKTLLDEITADKILAAREFQLDRMPAVIREDMRIAIEIFLEDQFQELIPGYAKSRFVQHLTGRYQQMEFPIILCMQDIKNRMISKDPGPWYLTKSNMLYLAREVLAEINSRSKCARLVTYPNPEGGIWIDLLRVRGTPGDGCAPEDDASASRSAPEGDNSEKEG